MATAYPNKSVLDSRFESFKNYSVASTTNTITGATLGASNGVFRSFTIPLDRANSPTQLQLNYSFDSSNWYTLQASTQIFTPGVFQILTSVSYGATSITINLLITNFNAGSATIADFTVTTRAYYFVAPW